MGKAWAIKAQGSIATLPLPKSLPTDTQGKSGLTILQSHESVCAAAKGGVWVQTGRILS